MAALWLNYLKVALRAFGRNRAYAATIVGGLALGLAGSLLILVYVHYERSYDSWLPDSGRIHQVQTTIRPPALPAVESQASPLPLRDALIAGFPQIEAVTSIASGKTVTEHSGQPMFIEATTVDPEFFHVLPLPFAQGSAATALPDTNSIVLTQSEAIRQLGTADALGKRLSLGAGPGKRDYRVTGVLKDLPRNTSLKIGIVFRRDLSGLPPEMLGWGSFDQQHYVKLRAGADPAAVNAALPAWEKRAIAPMIIEGKAASMSDVIDFRLVPIGDVHLGSAQDRAIAPGGDPRALATFTIVALLTLGMAVMNFVNLTTARAARRAPEVALRKVLGARRGQLIAQFVGENFLACAAAMLLALAMVELATPWLAHLLGADLRFAYLGDSGMLLPALALLAAAGIACSLYPAVYLSRFRPAQVLRADRGSSDLAGRGGLRSALVVVQFAIAIGLIASTAVIWSQTRFVQTVDPGFRRDGLVRIANAWRFTQGSEYEAARSALLSIPGVTGVGRTGLELGSTEKTAWLTRAAGATDFVTTSYQGIDGEFLQTMDIRLLAGRMLGDRFATDRIDSPPEVLAERGITVAINRSAAAKLGYRDPQAAVGRSMEIAYDGSVMMPATIAGVVEDSRFGTAREPIDPIVYAYEPKRANQAVMVRYSAARPGEVMAGLARVWRRFEPEIPFEARFVDDIVRELYAAERARTFLFAAFSLLAILIACLGLFGLAAFTAQRRTKEIGIRKVFGARIRDIVRLLAWQFSKPVIAANLIAWPVAWWVMRDWLNGFDARIALGPSPFVLAGLIALAIAVGTVAGHALKVARANPIHALRYE
ncbi:MAG TPA: ABC transporter permease [Allosphingosinicella sp.]|jgi:putative ABC transport system permease protein